MDKQVALMTNLSKLEKRVKLIEKRNKRVELDKDWETSLTRKAILFLLTYLTIALYFKAINIQKPFANAVVPAVGFYLSTLSLPIFRKLWEKYIRR